MSLPKEEFTGNPQFADKLSPIVLVNRLSFIGTDISLIHHEAEGAGVTPSDLRIAPQLERAHRRRGEILGRALLMQSDSMQSRFLEAETSVRRGERLWSGSQNDALFVIRTGHPAPYIIHERLHRIRVDGRVTSSLQAQALIGVQNVSAKDSLRYGLERTLNELQSEDALRYPRERYIPMIRLLSLLHEMPRGDSEVKVKIRVGKTTKQQKRDLLEIRVSYKSESFKFSGDMAEDEAVWKELGELIVLDSWSYRQ